MSPVLGGVTRPALCLAVLVMFGCGCAEPAEGDGSPWRSIVAGTQAEAERLATIDLQRYLGQVSGDVPVILSPDEWEERPRPAVVVGTADTNRLVRRLSKSRRAELGEQGYRLDQRTIAGARVVVAVGATAEGAVNAIYGLLRKLGFGFYLGSEVQPPSLPPGLGTVCTVPTPRLAIRGVLPWYNFFNSPTTWDPIDHRAFVDQLIRSGANFVGYHTYDTEPFAAYEEDGTMKLGARLLDTGTATWGTNPMATRDFACGTDKLFAHEFFGADTTRITSRTAAIRAEQQVMSDALDYAHRRGLRTCIGFEVTGDPTLSDDRDSFVRRLRHVLARYPVVDYVWIWQPEAQGVQGFNIRPTLPDGRSSSSTLPLYATARSQTFGRIVDCTKGEGSFLNMSDEGRFKRAAEAVRLEQYARLARRILRQHSSPPGLIVSGWGGDDRLLSAEYYEGLDRLLPRDVVFSSLDFINPRPRIDAIYHELPASRHRWPIPWLEFDGDQWQPQPYVHIFEGIVREMHRSGCQGILGIHWRTRDIEENFAYMIDAAWQPGLTAQQFYRDFARRCYAPAIADEMAIVHRELDRLHYRWVGGGGQNECAPFSWGPGDPAKAAALENLRVRAAQLAPAAAHSALRLDWLNCEMDWVLRYRHVEECATSASALLARAGDPRTTHAARLAEQALALLNDDVLAQALRSYARRITTRGEYGVLATVNTKAVVAWRALRENCRAILGNRATTETVAQWGPESSILLPRFLGSVVAGSNLTLEPLVLGGKPAWMHFRSLGAARWRSMPMQTVRGWVQRATVPADAVDVPGLELAFSFSGSAADAFALGPFAVTAMPETPGMTGRIENPLAAKSRLQVRFRTEGVMPVELTWNDVEDAVFYRVWRNDSLVAETAVPFFPDCPTEKRARYRVEAVRDGGVLAQSRELRVNVSDLVPRERVRLAARASGSGVVVRWPATRSPSTTTYTLRRERTRVGGNPDALRFDPSRGRLVRNVAADRSHGHVVRDTPPPGRWVYGVRPVAATGTQGRVASVTVDFPPLAGELSELRLPLTETPTTGTVEGQVEFCPDGARFGKGALILSHGTMMDMEFGMTLECEFKAISTSEVPVLMSCGFWETDGWFVQIIHEQLVVRTPGGDAQGPRVETGKWYRLRWTFDGTDQHLFIDGRQIPQAQMSLPAFPCRRDLVIGQYEFREPRYAFDGFIRNVRIASGTGAQ